MQSWTSRYVVPPTVQKKSPALVCSAVLRSVPRWVCNAKWRCEFGGDDKLLWQRQRRSPFYTSYGDIVRSMTERAICGRDVTDRLTAADTVDDRSNDSSGDADSRTPSGIVLLLVRPSGTVTLRLQWGPAT